MADRPRVTYEKSRVVRRRYQRSNKRFQFTASEIARIEREQERKDQAEKLREKEKRRIQKKKKRAEKEAKAREERLRLGLPDPDAPKVPASQPLLFNFIKQAPPAKVERQGGQTESETESQGTVAASTIVASDFETEFDDGDVNFEDEEMDELMVTLGAASESIQGKCDGPRSDDAKEEEFSDCSFPCDEEFVEEIEAIARETPVEQVSVGQMPGIPGLASQVFADDTALLLEYVDEFDAGTSFDEALAQLDGL
ncbi:uncharacterized protein BJX67DRAFT_352004 [Aspergillus lucknowensis]|uniref:Uncharacterized protein n=1 Tax=Aspergillus lucknowensis TaxID=176173 RepID=A0ABR4LV22_9EURO